MFQLKVIKYTDELESGKRSRKPELTIPQQIEHHRQKLLIKVTNSTSTSIHFYSTTLESNILKLEISIVLF